jgi:hypothetical protein
MTDDRPWTRRALLAAGAVTLGGGALGGTAIASSDPVSFDQQQQVQVTTDGGDRSAGDSHLRVDWKEWYNGRPVERQDTPTQRGADDRGVLAFPNILPGDHGRVTIGLSTEASGEGTDPPAVEVLIRIREPPGTRRENGRNEPEEKAGDGSPDTGELQEFLQLEIWYDTGIQVTNTPVYGYCDAEENLGDSTFLSGSLAELSTVGTDQTLANETWRSLDTDASNPVGSGACLRPDEAMCLTVEWSIAGNVPNVNRIQGDSVSPVIEIAAVQCS